MRAELIILGKRLDMAPRTNRRTLVVFVYAGLAAALTAFWFMDRWRVTGFYIIFATFLVNRFFLGGYNFGGLIKPFNGKPPRQELQLPPFLVLGLRRYQPEPEEGDYSNDERELQQRDHAHYQAYQWISLVPCLIWLLASAGLNHNRVLIWMHISLQTLDILIYALALSAMVVGLTLPQAILLWAEPDMAELDNEE